MDVLWIGSGTVAAGLAGLLGRAWRQRRVAARERDAEIRREVAEIEAHRRTSAAQEAALQDAARAVARLESSLARREDALERAENDLHQRAATLTRHEADVAAETERLRAAREDLERRASEVGVLEAEARRTVEETRARWGRAADLDPEEARRLLLETLDHDLESECARRVHVSIAAARAEAEHRARDIVVTAIQRLAVEQCGEATVTRVAIPSDEWKGRVIGREGRNVRALEAATGCDIVVDDTPGAVLVCGYDGVRREVARRALERLLDEGRLQPGRIEEVVAEERERVEEMLDEAGREAAALSGVHDLAPEILSVLGRLQFRTSYGQNVLRHSTEVALLCGLMAAELGLDPALARRAGLLHDLGKGLDHHLEGPHHDIAGRVLRRHGEDEAVATAVEAHHDTGDRLDAYAALVQVADAISASRPGARRESAERYIERLAELERIATRFPGVERAYAVHAGREVRVLVDAAAVDDVGASGLAWEVARAIERDLAWKGEIRVTVIREVRAVETAR